MTNEILADGASARRYGEAPSPVVAESLRFLNAHAPTGPWALTALMQDEGREDTATFSPGEDGEVASWVESRNRSGWNIYYHVNPVREPVSKKATKAEIAAVAYAHLDCDPRVGEDIVAEQHRIESLLTDAGKLRQKLVPPPTFVIASGGGYNALWRFKTPHPLPPGDELAIRQAECRSKGLSAYLDGDKVHDVSRILRLPGTVNWPDAKKRRRGRAPALARLIVCEPERAYDLGEIPTVTIGEEKPKSKRAAATTVPVADVAELGEAVPGRCKVVIVQGIDPDNPKRHPSRSEWVHYVCCELARAGIDDGRIVGVITNPAFGISAHVLDQKNPERYARRQVEKARAAICAPAPGGGGSGGADDRPGPRDVARALLGARPEPLIHLNDQWHTWRHGAYRGREDDTLRREMYDHLERVGAKPNQRAVSNVLDAVRSLVHLDRGDFSPPCWMDVRSGPDPRELLVCRNGLLHLPSGERSNHDPAFLTHNALDYDHDPAAPPPERWTSFLREVWPAEDERDCIESLRQWFGYLLAPDTSQQKILVLVGPKRSGKGTIARILTALLGQHNVCAPRLSQFGEQFGLQSLIGKQVAIVSDMRLGGRSDKAAIAEALLAISGEDFISIPRKNLTDWEGRLRTRFVVMSNEPPAITDASGALPSRFVVLQMRQSFYGREDVGLTDRLLSERSGILNWAIDGWRAMQTAGRLTQPASSADTVRQISRLSQVVGAFVEDECEVEAGAHVDKDELFRRFRVWVEQEAIPWGASKDVFCKELLSTTAGRVRNTRAREGGGRRWVFQGIRLLTDRERNGVDSPF